MVLYIRWWRFPLEIQGKELAPMSLHDLLTLVNIIVNLIGLAYKILKDR